MLETCVQDRSVASSASRGRFGLLQRIAGALQVLVGAIAPLALGSSLGGWEARADSVAYQMNLAHDGAQNGTGIAPPLSRRWSVDLPGVSSYPVIAQGRIIVATRAGASAFGPVAVRAFSSTDGSLLWGPVAVGGDRGAALALDGDRVYCVDSGGTIRALRASDGTQLWSHTPWNFADAPPIASNGRVYAAIAGTMRCYDGATGAVLWSRSDPNGQKGAAALDASGLYVPHSSPPTFKLNAQTGALLWQAASGSFSYSYTPVLRNNKLYTRDFPETVIDALTGAHVGTLQLQSAPVFASTANGEIAVTVTRGTGSYEGVMRGLNATTGAEKWKFSGDGTLYSAPLLLDGVLFAASANGSLYAVNPTNGAALWSNRLNVEVPKTDEHSSSLHLFGLGAGEGVLVIPARGKLLAYERYTGNDSAPPVVSIDTPAADSLSREVGTISGVARDEGIGIDSMSLVISRPRSWGGTEFWDGYSWYSYRTTLKPTFDGARWSYAFPPFSPYGATFMDSGEYTVEVSATDRLLQSASTTSKFRIDRTSPAATLSEPTGTIKSFARLAGTVRDSGGSTVASMQFTLHQSDGCSTYSSTICGQWWDGTKWVANGPNVTPPMLTATLEGENWKYESVPTDAPNGTYEVSMRPTDALGNGGSSGDYNQQRSFYVDRKGPSVTFASPGNNLALSSLGEVKGTASDGSGVAWVKIALRHESAGYWNGGAWAQSQTPVLLAAAVTPSTTEQGIFDWKLESLPAGASLIEGRYFLSSVAQDNLGNFPAQPTPGPSVFIDATCAAHHARPGRPAWREQLVPRPGHGHAERRERGLDLLQPQQHWRTALHHTLHH
jgi:outer membrane protein assembly factor BamB